MVLPSAGNCMRIPAARQPGAHRRPLTFREYYVTIKLHIMAYAASYSAIADPTRRRILDALRSGSLNAGAIARRFHGISRPAVSKHLRILRGAQLVIARRQGRQLLYSLNAAPLREVNAWLRRYESFWDHQLKSFRKHVESTSTKGGRL